MKDINSILFVADGSSTQRSAFSRALRLAYKHNARLTLVRDPETGESLLNDPKAELQAQMGRADAAGNPIDNKQDESQRTMTYLSRNARVTEIESRMDPAALIRLLEQRPHDLLIKAARRASGVLRGMFADYDAVLMRHCPCPVWIIRHNPDSARPDRVLAAVDVLSTKPGGQELASRVLDVAVALAERNQSELHVLHTWHVAGEAMLRGSPIHVSEVRRLLEQIRATHETRLEHLLENVSYRNTSVHLRKGRAHKVIRELLEVRDFGDIVIGMHDRNQYSPAYCGNMAKRILGIANCSVLAVKAGVGAVSHAAV